MLQEKSIFNGFSGDSEKLYSTSFGAGLDFSGGVQLSPQWVPPFYSERWTCFNKYLVIDDVLNVMISCFS